MLALWKLFGSLHNEGCLPCFIETVDLYKSTQPMTMFLFDFVQIFYKARYVAFGDFAETVKSFNSLAIPFHFTALQQRSPFQTAALQFETLILSDGSTVDCKPAHSHHDDDDVDDDDDDDGDDDEDDKAMGNKL